MKERGMIFNTEMVQAIREGQKVQTRRPIKNTGLYAIDKTIHGKEITDREKLALLKHCPYGVPGDILYVRETWKSLMMYDEDDMPTDEDRLFYKADGVPDIRLLDGDGFEEEDQTFKWKPSIHMPKKYARTFLEITDIRVERVNDISEEDALKEGVISNEAYEDNAGSEGLFNCPDCDGMQVHGCFGENYGVSECDCKTCDTQKKRFSLLWESIYGSDNCWVWVLEFKRVDKKTGRNNGKI